MTTKVENTGLFAKLEQDENQVADHEDAQFDKKEFGLEALGAAGYLLTCPLLGFFPHILGILPGFDEWLAHDLNVINFRMLMAVVFWMGLIDIFALNGKSMRAVRVTIGWRLYIVAPTIIYVAVMQGIPLMLLITIALLDVGVPILMVLVLKREGFGIVSKTFFLTLMPPFGKDRQLRDWYAYSMAFIGNTACLLAMVDSIVGHGFFAPEETTSVFTFAVGTLMLYGITLCWVAHDGSDRAHNIGFTLGVCLSASVGLWYWAGVEGFLVANLAVHVGLLWGIYLYTLLWQFMVSPRGRTRKASPAQWLIGNAALLAVISSVWFSMSSFYGKPASTLSPNIHGQDLLVCMLAVATGIMALEENLKADGSGPAHVISWMLPMAAIYFTCETKMLAHLGVGTPFHPSWNARGLAPVWGQYEIVNYTFWIATFLLTAFGTTVTCGFVMKFTKCTEGWARLTLHGTLQVLVSGWFMAMFVSGLPPPLQAMGPTMNTTTLPSDVGTIPPLLLGCSKVEAVQQHTHDLQVGIFLMIAGPLASKFLPNDTSMYSWFVIGVCWFMLISGKVRLAMHSNQYPDLYPGDGPVTSGFSSQ